MNKPSFLDLPGERRIAYHAVEGRAPTVIFMGGFKSDMTGSKAMALDTHCSKHGQRFIRFDYTGHGQSSGQFKDGTIGSWKQDALDVLDTLGGDHNILVGSSMGAWLAHLCALARPKKIIGLVGIASAPDFTENLVWSKMNDAQKKQMTEEGAIYLPSCYGEEPYPITRRLLEEGRNHLLLTGSIDIRVPVRLIHGTHDEDVPWQTSVTLMEKLASADVRLTLIKNGNHRLSEPDQLSALCNMLGEF